MKLFKLTREADWDETEGMILRAVDGARALKLASEFCKVLENDWDLEEVTVRGEEEIILVDFNAG